jgi:hypothetical protein
MARKKEQTKAPTAKDFIVPAMREFFVSGAREFVTFGPALWTENPDLGDSEVRCSVSLKGAFVRLEPPAEATDEQVAKVKRYCEANGAVRVSVLPRRRAAQVVAPTEKRPHRKVREVVAELVDAANVEDREGLRTTCETIMSKRNL